MATMYQNAWGVPKDIETARNYCKLAFAVHPTFQQAVDLLEKINEMAPQPSYSLAFQ